MRKRGSGVTFEDTPPVTYTFQLRSHLLDFPEPSKIAAVAGGQVLSLWGTFPVHTIISSKQNNPTSVGGRDDFGQPCRKLSTTYRSSGIRAKEKSGFESFPQLHPALGFFVCGE